MSAKTYRNGDKVSLTITGTVRHARDYDAGPEGDGTAFYVKWDAPDGRLALKLDDSYFNSSFADDVNAGLKLVERAKPVLKVGDTVKGNRYRDLPVGSVAVCKHSSRPIDTLLRTEAGLVNGLGNKVDFEDAWSPRVIVHLPA